MQRAYELYGHATGLPSPLLENAALYWQSKSTYRDRAEVIGVARNFSQRNLSVGMIVIAHDDVPCSPAFKNCTPPVRSSPEKACHQRTVYARLRALLTRLCLQYYRFDPQRFPDVPGMVKAVADLTGALVMPNIKPTSIATQDCAMCGLLGGSAGQATDGQADDGLIDPTGACGECLWAKRLKPYMFDQGITTYWLDDDETNKFAPKSALPPLPSPQVEVGEDQRGHPPKSHAPRFRCGPTEFCGMWLAGKAWPQVFAQGVESEGGPAASKPLLLSRNAWAGAAAHGVALWSSDIPCSWKELNAQVSIGLSSGLSGIPFWSSDVGGFACGPSMPDPLERGGTLRQMPPPELVARWHQFGSVSPLYRTHGDRLANEPWSFGPEAEASIVKSIRLRTSLKSYIMELARNASAHGTPIMTPLWFFFPDDPELLRHEIVTTFMFGPRYLAAPVLELGARNRTLYLPPNAGGWTHYYSRARFAGGANVTVPAPFDELPLFVRG